MQVKVRSKRLSSISSISIADVVLLLLIFFLLTSTYVVQTGIKVKLPRAGTSEGIIEQHISISITKEGELFLNDKRVSAEELRAALSTIFASNPDKPTVLRADRDVSVEQLVRVMDIAQEAGATRFLLGTKPLEAAE